MIVLNLISEECKKEIKLRRFYQLIKKINYILIIIFIIATIVLLIAQIILQNNFNQIVEQTTLITKNNLSHSNKIKEINNKLKFISEIQNNFIVWSKIIKDLSIITPANVILNFVKLDSINKNVKLQGKATQRVDLLKLKNNLEKSIIYSNIKFPIKNILEKENIDFEINANIDI
ncbi:MAG: hypothetical protein ABH818_01985 [Patescibacteria group bacterium]